MSLLILDSDIEARLIEQRRAWGADRYDEVWDGVYVMAPLPNNEHQEIVARLVRIFDETLGDCGLARVLAGVNLARPDLEDWTQDYRIPDVAVFTGDTRAQNCDTHWRGPADFLVEITSPGDRTADKIPFYSAIGVVELLVVNRESWTLELYRHDGDKLAPAGSSVAGSREALESKNLPFTFQLLPGSGRPRIRVIHGETGRSWDL